MSEKIEWNVIKNFECIGKKEVIEQCEKTEKYFASVIKDFKQLDVIKTNKKIALTGTAEFSEDGNGLNLYQLAIYTNLTLKKY